MSRSGHLLATAFCWGNACLYAALALWCWWSPAQTAAGAGLVPVNNAGITEFQAVYAGMEAAFAAFYVMAALHRTHLPSALLFSLLLYGGLVLFRSLSIMDVGFATLGATRFLYLLEIALLTMSALLWFRRPGPERAPP